MKNISRKQPSFYTALTTLFLMLLFTLNACQSLSTNFEKPQLEITSIKMLPANSDNNHFALDMRFDIGLRISNPNNKPLNLNGLSYVLDVEGLDVIQGVAKDIPEVLAYDSTEFSTIAHVNLLRGFGLFSKMMRMDNLENVDYVLKAKLDTGIPMIGKVNINKKGSIALKPAQNSSQ